LEARLQQYAAQQEQGGGDDDDPMGRLDGGDESDGGAVGMAADATVGTDTPGSAPAVAPTEPAPPVELPDPPAAKPTEFRQQYLTHGPPDDATHQQLCAQVREEALAAGHQVRGHGYRAGTVTEGGQRFEVYVISLRRT
jgi:hypothetical protein